MSVEKAPDQSVSGNRSANMATVNIPKVVYEEDQTEKLTRKIKENPFFPVAIMGFTGTAAYGLWGLKNRGNTPLSLYLIQLRVAAQGLAVGTLTLGVAYVLGKRIYNLYNGIDDYDPKSGR